MPSQDPNRLELVISIKDDGSAGAESVKARYKGIVDDARSMNVLLDKEIANLSASAQRSVDAWVRRSALVGKTGEDRIIAQANILKSKVGDGDKAVTDAIDEGTRAQVAAWRRRQQETDRARAAADTKRQGTLAGQATLAGEAEFQNAFKRLQDREAMVQGLRDRAEMAGKKASERFAIEGARTVAGLASTPKLAAEAAQYYKTLEDAARKAEEAAGSHGGNQAIRRGILGVKDLIEGSTRGAIIEGTDVLIGTSAQGGILPGIVSNISEITGVSTAAVYGVAALGAAFVGLGIAGAKSVKDLATTGEEIKNFSVRTGIAPENVQAFQFAAQASGVDENIYPRMVRSLSQISDDDSTAGVKGRAELKQLGVNLYDTATGQMKPTEQIILDIADAFEKLPPGLQKSAASMEVFKRAGIDAPIVLRDIRANLIKSDEIGNTFSASDLQMMDEWRKSLAAMGEEWKRFRLQFEMPLAITVIAALKVVKPVAGILSGQTEFRLSEEAMNYASEFLFPGQPELPGKNAGGTALLDPNRLGNSIQFQRAQQARSEYDALRNRDAKYVLQQARKEQAALDAEAAHGDEDAVRAAKEGFIKLQALEKKSNPDADKGLQAIIAAGQERLSIQDQILQQRLSAQQSLDRIGLDNKRELATPEDIRKQLDLADQVAQGQTNAAIEKSRRRVDPKTGRIVDLSNTPEFKTAAQAQISDVLPERQQLEYGKVLAQMAESDARYFKNRTDESMKRAEEEWQKRQAGELALQDQIIKIGNEISDRRTQIDIEANDRAKNIAIEGLGSINAQTLKDKMSLEDQKFAIEKSYADRGLELQLQRLNTERVRAVGEIEKHDRDQGIDPTTNADTQKLIQLTNEKYGQDADALRQTNADRELSDAMKVAKAKEDLQIQSNRKIYDSLKQDAAGLFDQLVSHTKSWADFAKDLFKSAILTPVKDIFSSQVAGLFTGLITGNKVTFDPVGTGQGKLGGLEGALGRAGLGQPHFNIPRETPFVSSKLESTVEGNAVRVIVTNPQQVGAAHAQAAQSSYAPIGAALASSFGSTILSHTRTAQQQGLASSLFIPQAYEGGTGQDSSLADNFGSLIMSGGRNAQYQGFTNAYSDVSPNGFQTMGEISALGTPQGIFSPLVPPPFVDQNLSGAQVFDATDANLGPEAAMASPSGSGGGIFSQIGSMFGLGGTSAVHGTPPFIGGGGSSGGLGGILGGGGGLGSIFNSSAIRMNLGGTSMTTSAGIARSLGGGILGHAAGGLAGFASSGMGTTLGLGVALDGIRRGGVTGTLEAAGGGALVGFRYGGPIGAVIGAAVGGGIAAGKSIFGTTDRQHAKDLVKQVYGMDINNATADSIVQIAKQSFGNQIDVAVRSPQVRELLKLYSQATGQKKAEDQFAQSTIHGASLVESNGRLMQQAVYDNGNAYAYSSQLGTYQGVQTSPLSTYQPNQGVFSGNLSINLNGQSAADALEGRVTNVVTPGFVQGQSLAASNSSIGRASQTRMTLSPSAIPG